eukprot:XP_001694700.1 glutathione reductase [Chlamydomonas reinhardtii]
MNVAMNLAQGLPRHCLKAVGTRSARLSRGLCTRVSASASAGEQFDFDLFTIGAGSGGVRGSRFASSYGAKVAVWTLPPGAATHSWTAFIEAKRKELQRLNGAYKNTLKNAKVELVEGRGRVVDAHTVEVVGGKPHKLDIPGAELCITSDEALELPACPQKVAVLGGGYIAVEFAGIFSRFGAEVHTVYRQPLPLRGFDEEVKAEWLCREKEEGRSTCESLTRLAEKHRTDLLVRKFAAEQYAAAGLHLHAGCNPVSVSKQPNGKLSLVVKGPDGATSTLTDLDQVMMATGRVPKTSGLGLEEAGVKMGSKGQVLVDEYCRTNVPSIWAVGDVIDRIQLTPVPSAVFSNPEIATVGYSEEQAAEKYGDVDIYTTSFKPMRNTISGSPIRTFMKIVVDAASQKVVGMHMVGAEAAEIMQLVAYLPLPN